MRILIVEDDRVSALILARTLEKVGHEVITATNGEEAWEIYQKEPLPLIISDWMMPQMDGPDLCRRVRATNSDHYTYFMLLTAKGNRDDRLEGLQAGADDFLIKPLDTGELLARLGVAQRILSMQEELQNRSTQLEKLHTELAQQNDHLEEAMTYLTAANQRFTELFEGLPAACYSIDEEGRIHEWNRAAVLMFGHDPEEVIAQHIWDVFREKDPRRQEQNVIEKKEMIRRIFAGEAIEDLEIEERCKDGTKRHVLCNILPMKLPDGRISGAIAAHIDITERKTLEKQVADQLRMATDLNQELEEKSDQLRELVVTDGLTGLKNHRGFREILDSSFSFAVRQGLPFSLIMLDVDHFKQYNDTFGHPAGDDVLREVANVLRTNVRAHDIVARYGGEEFVVLCPATDWPGARDVADRLRQAIEEHTWPHRPVTASFGAATFGAGTGTSSELVDQADKALYRSKQAGRNQVAHFLDPLPAAA
jgi:two-component system, cell cycle response regulator